MQHAFFNLVAIICHWLFVLFLCVKEKQNQGPCTYSPRKSRRVNFDATNDSVWFRWRLISILGINLYSWLIYTCIKNYSQVLVLIHLELVREWTLLSNIEEQLSLVSITSHINFRDTSLLLTHLSLWHQLLFLINNDWSKKWV